MTKPEVRLSQLLADEPEVTVSAAESCTGGAVANKITSVPGSSNYFQGGVVAYSNKAKTNLLGVDASIFVQFGAVSRECAEAMATGCRDAFATTIAVSTTGIAGPGGATATKPVGLVYIAVASAESVCCEELRLHGDRVAIMNDASQRAVEMVNAAIERRTKQEQE